MLPFFGTGSPSILRYHIFENTIQILRIYQSELLAPAPGEFVFSRHFVAYFFFQRIIFSVCRILSRKGERQSASLLSAVLFGYPACRIGYELESHVSSLISDFTHCSRISTAPLSRGAKYRLLFHRLFHLRPLGCFRTFYNFYCLSIFLVSLSAGVYASLIFYLVYIGRVSVLIFLRIFLFRTNFRYWVSVTFIDFLSFQNIFRVLPHTRSYGKW